MFSPVPPDAQSIRLQNGWKPHQMGLNEPGSAGFFRKVAPGFEPGVAETIAIPSF
jgi:hypothetical protein